MKTYNIYNNNIKDLGNFSDNRGTIYDVFFDISIYHVTMIYSEKNTIRGNHYHKKTTQHILILSGQLEYWYKKNNSDEKSNCYLAKQGDVITSEPGEIHAMKTSENSCCFLVFTEGIRGGHNYECDTFRVDSIIE